MELDPHQEAPVALDKDAAREYQEVGTEGYTPASE
jgi:hypothetical protein